MPISVVPRKNSTFAMGRLELAGVAVAVSVIVAPAWNTAPLAGAVSEADSAARAGLANPAAQAASPRPRNSRVVPCFARFIVVVVMARLTE